MRLTRRSFARSFVAACALATLGACASSSSSTGEATRTDQSVLTAEELSSVGVSNVYDAVERLRPRWLQIRTTRSLGTPAEIVVFMNRSYLGGPEVLRQFTPNNVARLRYLDAAQAYATLSGIGGRAVESAIIVELTGGN